MPRVFADTSYWIARHFPDDQWHTAALAAERRLGRPLYLITTQEVLTEFLASMAGNIHRRNLGVRLIDGVQGHPQIEVIPQSDESFAKGFDLYRSRLDKGYSLVDCVSMTTMDEFGISLILTSDHHFEQEGRFVALMLLDTP